jgi:uncharacterized protein (DUF1778 family)
VRTASKHQKKQISSRLNFRLHPDIKARIERAAELSGQTLTDFATAAVLEKAAEVILSNTTIDLAEEDREFLFTLLDEDTSPSRKSKAAAARYRKGHYEGNVYHW